LDLSGALCGYTRENDTRAVLTLLCHAVPTRVLEIGTALGHMTANLTRWTPADSWVFTLGLVEGMPRAAAGAMEQRGDTPAQREWGRFANYFGTAHKAFFIMADSMTYDFGRLAPLDFVFIDGAHDMEHVLNDSRKAYDALAPGGWLVWHDFDSPVPWVRVREAVEQMGFVEEVVHVEGTEVAFLRKGVWPSFGQAEQSRPAPGDGAQQLDHALRLGASSTFGRTLPVEALIPPPHTLRHGGSATFGHPLPVGARGTMGGVSVAWEGEFEELHSLALVNRAVCRELVCRGHDVRRIEAHARVLNARRDDGATPALMHVRHQWPPKMERPLEGKWVLMQPWEFGSIPKGWLPMLGRVDEVWAYSRYVRDCYLDAGVPPERVQIIPLGVDPEVYRPGVERLHLSAGAEFRFLFVGGTIFRKGIDVVLKAFGRAFQPGDGIGLVVKDMGSKSFYRGQTAGEQVGELRKRGYPVEYIDWNLSELAMAGLYAACDCLVHPFRGEGFGLPVVEAMACGLPVIVTGAGPALDYASDETSYLIPANRGQFAECRVGDIETIGRPWLFEPDADALVELLKRVTSDRAGANAKGTAASAHIRQIFTWARTADAVERRLAALCNSGCDNSRAAVVPKGVRAEAGTEARPTEIPFRTSSGAGLRAAAGTEARPTEVPFQSSGGAGLRAEAGTEARPTDAEARLTDVPLHSSSGAGLRARGTPAGRESPSVSLTMIVRDEEINLPNCLRSVAGLFDEVVIVDTGSKDRTREIAREFGARVFDFVWVGDFAAARNAALARAKGDYAFWLDADDVIDPPEREKLQALLDSLRPGWEGEPPCEPHLPATREGEPPCEPIANRRAKERMPARIRHRRTAADRPPGPPPADRRGAYVVKCACDPEPDGTGGRTVVDHIRLFPVRGDIRWMYRVHEQILPALRRGRIPVHWTDITVRHTGYTDRALRARKLDRDASILREELADRPDDPFVLFNLGQDAIERCNWREALEYLRHSLAGSAATDSITHKLYALMARSHQMLGEFPQSLAACAKGLSFTPDDAELLFREAMVRRRIGDDEGAERSWRKILTLRRPDEFASVEQGIYGHLTRRNLAALAHQRGDHEEARKLWRTVLEECPGDREAMSHVGE
jgi:glycosyltransferase involved in cell wall biosynthesis